jgi:hypothetical protein
MAGHTEQSIVIDAPFQLVWEMTNDVAACHICSPSTRRRKCSIARTTPSRSG